VVPGQRKIRHSGMKANRMENMLTSKCDLFMRSDFKSQPSKPRATPEAEYHIAIQPAAEKPDQPPPHAPRDLRGRHYKRINVKEARNTTTGFHHRMEPVKLGGWLIEEELGGRFSRGNWEDGFREGRAPLPPFQ
jgi:hypothetical protein